MKNTNYKYFKEGDSIVCIGRSTDRLYLLLFSKQEYRDPIKLYHTYIFDRYLVREGGGIIYDALVLKDRTPLYSGENFILLSEYRRLKLKKIKKKIFFKNFIRKLVKLKYN